MPVTAEQVRDDLIELIEGDKIILPTLPEVALQAREVAEDPEVSGSDLSKVIANDTALSARIIKVANSPLLRANRKIDDLLMAVNRLGITFTANLITGLAMEQMFQATNDIIDKKMRDVWSHSTEVAGIAHVLCKQFTKLKPDQATLGGLVSEIGVLPILTYAEEQPELLENPTAFDEVIKAVHPIIGTKILKAWDFPEELQLVPAGHLDFSREIEIADYADIVTVAYLQCLGDTAPDSIDLSAVKAYDRLGINLEEIENDEDLSAQMAEAASLLQ